MKKILSLLLKYGIPIAISAGLAWFLYTNVDVDAISRSLRDDVNYWWFAPVIVVSVFSHVFRALRWQLQLKAIGVKAPFGAILNSIFGTYFVNLAFPRLGEVWRTGYIAKRQRASFSHVFGSMMGDRLSDTVMVALLTLITFFLAHEAFMKFLGSSGGSAGSSSWLVWAGVAGVAVLGVAAIWWVMRGGSQNGLVVKLRLMLANLWDGLASIARMEGKWLFLLYTLLIWGCYYMQLYLASFAFTFTNGLGALPVLVLFVLSSIGMAVPSNGGLGPWQFAIIFGLSLYDVGAFPPSTPYDAQASAFAWLVWGVQTVLLIVLGIYAFVSMEIDRQRIAQGKTVVEASGEEMTL